MLATCASSSTSKGLATYFGRRVGLVGDDASEVAGCDLEVVDPRIFSGDPPSG